jgi:hypothetical protein
MWNDGGLGLRQDRIRSQWMGHGKPGAGSVHQGRIPRKNRSRDARSATLGAGLDHALAERTLGYGGRCGSARVLAEPNRFVGGHCVGDDPRDATSAGWRKT